MVTPRPLVQPLDPQSPAGALAADALTNILADIMTAVEKRERLDGQASPRRQRKAA